MVDDLFMSMFALPGRRSRESKKCESMESDIDGRPGLMKGSLRGHIPNIALFRLRLYPVLLWTEFIVPLDAKTRIRLLSPSKDTVSTVHITFHAFLENLYVMKTFSDAGWPDIHTDDLADLASSQPESVRTKSRSM
jgi:hypothetical protein